MNTENTYDPQLHIMLSLVLLCAILIIMPMWFFLIYVAVQISLGFILTYYFNKVIGYDGKYDYIYFSILFISTSIVFLMRIYVEVVFDKTNIIRKSDQI